MDNEVKETLDLILSKLSNLERGQEKLEKEVAKLGNGQEKLEKEMEKLVRRQESMETRQDEIFQVVKAIEHSNNVGKAKIDILEHKVHRVEGTINEVGEVIQDRKII